MTVYWMQGVFDAGSPNGQGWERWQGVVVDQDELYVVVQMPNGKRKLVAKENLIEEEKEPERGQRYGHRVVIVESLPSNGIQWYLRADNKPPIVCMDSEQSEPGDS